jgi:hypothetical protein
MNLVDVEGFTNLKKDPSSGGVVNVDKKSYMNYMASKNIALQRRKEHMATNETVTHLQEQINTIKGDLVDIKTILLKILEKGN